MDQLKDVPYGLLTSIGCAVSTGDPVPAAFSAITRMKYSFPSSNLLILKLLAWASAVPAVIQPPCLASRRSITYPVIGKPPLLSGVSQEMVRESFSIPVTRRLVGADGGAGGETSSRKLHVSQCTRKNNNF